MFLYELLTLIGFTKIQQISLIKILFFTGCFAFVEPKGLEDLKEVIEINSGFLSSEIKEILLFHKNDSQIPDETAEKILKKAEFKSKIQAFEWLDSIMQRKFHRGSKQRAEVTDQFQNNIVLEKLLEEFNLKKQILQEGNFDSALVLGSLQMNFQNRMEFLADQLKKNTIKTAKIFIIGAERLGFPYKEPIIETILAEKLSSTNHKSFKNNLKEVHEIFISTAIDYLSAKNISIAKDSETIRKFFKENPELYQIDFLTDKLKKHKILKEASWPTELEIGKKFIPSFFNKYNCQFLNTPNKIIDGKTIRGDTFGNAEIWLKEAHIQNLSHKPKILIVSSQPHGQYQLKAFESVLGNKFDIKVIATESNISNISLLLDELASIVHASKGLIYNNEGKI